MRPGIRDAVVSVGLLFFLAKCAAAAPAPALEKDDIFAPYAKGVRYVFEDIERGTPTYVTGGEAFEIAIAETRGSRLILYRKDGANAAPQPQRSR